MTVRCTSALSLRSATCRSDCNLSAPPQSFSASSCALEVLNADSRDGGTSDVSQATVFRSAATSSTTASTARPSVRTAYAPRLSHGSTPMGSKWLAMRRIVSAVTAVGRSEPVVCTGLAPHVPASPIFTLRQLRAMHSAAEQRNSISMNPTRPACAHVGCQRTRARHGTLTCLPSTEVVIYSSVRWREKLTGSCYLEELASHTTQIKIVLYHNQQAICRSPRIVHDVHTCLDQGASCRLPRVWAPGSSVKLPAKNTVEDNGLATHTRAGKSRAQLTDDRRFARGRKAAYQCDNGLTRGLRGRRGHQFRYWINLLPLSRRVYTSFKVRGCSRRNIYLGYHGQASC